MNMQKAMIHRRRVKAVLCLLCCNETADYPQHGGVSSLAAPTRTGAQPLTKALNYTRKKRNFQEFHLALNVVWEERDREGEGGGGKKGDRERERENAHVQQY